MKEKFLKQKNMDDMCYKNVQKMTKSKTTPPYNGEHVIMVALKINCYPKS
jgi:hypothetical protein